MMEAAFPDVSHPWNDPEGQLSEETANHMVENCFGTIALPLALALHVRVNQREPVAVPMAGEEPSVVAAVSGVSKLISTHGGFQAEAPRSNMVAQIQVLECPDWDASCAAVTEATERIMETANTFCAGMVKRGGGAKGIEVRRLHAAQEGEVPMLVVHLILGTGDAMGANMCNTVAEGVAPLIAELTGGRVGLRILSNLADQRIARASFSIPLEHLAYKGVSGEKVAKSVCEAAAFAWQDPHRAATHNKGIMNGIDAALLASGQDYRAVEAGAHAYAARDGQYRALTRYWVSDGHFKGSIAMPMAVGTVGGALQTHPTFRYVHGVLGHPTAARLSELLVCIGLAQNFAALRAMSTEGIQKGHMRLQARSVCAAAGVPEELQEACVEAMIAKGRITVEAAKTFLAKAGGLIQPGRALKTSDTAARLTARL